MRLLFAIPMIGITAMLLATGVACAAVTVALFVG